MYIIYRQVDSILGRSRFADDNILERARHVAQLEMGDDVHLVTCIVQGSEDRLEEDKVAFAVMWEYAEDPSTVHGYHTRHGQDQHYGAPGGIEHLCR